MSIFQGFLEGVRAYGKASKILFSEKFAWFLIFPVVIYILLFLLIGWLGGLTGGSLAEWAQLKILSWTSEISWLNWISSATGFLIRLMFRLIFFFLFIFFGGYIVLIVMSPIYSWLSERTERYVTGKEYPFTIRRLLWEVFRGIMIVIRNLFFQLLISFIIFILSFVPVVGIVAPFALFFVSAYFYGFSFIDYAVERKKYNIKESVRYINKNVGIVTGIGTVFALSLMLPCFRIIACCFVSLLSVIAGTVVINKMKE